MSGKVRITSKSIGADDEVTSYLFPAPNDEQHFELASRFENSADWSIVRLELCKLRTLGNKTKD